MTYWTLEMISRALIKVNEQVERFAQAALFDRAGTKPRLHICGWVASHIDMGFDSTGAQHGLVNLYPYQAEPLAATEKPGVDEITLMWGQRLGKSTIWRFSLLKRLFDGGCNGLIVYPSEVMAMRTNKDSVLPLLRTLPNLRADLAVPGGRRKDSYHLPSARSIVYFLGGTTQLINYTANWGAIDEADFIKVEKADENDENAQNVDQVRSLRLRMQTYKERLLIVTSSPTTHGGTINTNYQKGSRGVWHLKCLKCGSLSPANRLAYPKPDGTYAGLQWQKTEEGDIIEDSIRWICPSCGHPHVFEDAVEMNRRGSYIHANESSHHLSFQAGALANPWVWTWLQIAEKQEDAIDANGRRFLYNTVLGMPYKHTRAGDLSISIPDVLKSRQKADPPDLDARLSIVTAGIDQQAAQLAGAKYYVYAVRGWDEQGNSWGLAAGVANSTAELAQLVSRTWHGLPVALALMDAGGFDDNSQRTDPFVRAHANIMYYKGGDDRTNSLHGKLWRPSDNDKNLILCNAVAYQVKLLDLLYGPPKPRGHRFTISADASPSYMEQMAAMRPNNHMHNGHGDAFNNWVPGSHRHDFFDAEKMAIAALDVACALTPADRFRFGNRPVFWRAEQLREALRQQAFPRRPGK